MNPKHLWPLSPIAAELPRDRHHGNQVAEGFSPATSQAVEGQHTVVQRVPFECSGCLGV